ncbi:Uncharacterised protein [Streptococcus dysgalactiae subsp. dysgalactiae]|uniref:Uncharacterized protein n=1 Tax=Streptococcus dysgalactiae subsp. dysgalactiae TaxID=99822 RepID=A0A380JU35_STRDY|nr:Uncharacterised protein [Streptococcus dysgalactiae subsp. dysgalactiae]
MKIIIEKTGQEISLDSLLTKILENFKKGE